MKTKVRLRGWVLVVLKTILVIDMFLMSCLSDSMKVMIIKTLIGILVALPIAYLLIKYDEV